MIAAVLMSRVPVAGKTKTRLIGPLSAGQAANLHAAFLRDIGAQLRNCEDAITQVLYLGNEGPAARALHELPSDLEVIQQPNGTLGERMRYLFHVLFERGFDAVVLFGADVPQIQSRDIEKAHALLKCSDLVFGPTLDGGFYLIGMNKLHECVFRPEIAWGSDEAYRQSTQQIGTHLHLSEVRPLRDIDDVEDLIALRDSPDVALTCPETAHCLNTLVELDQWTA